MSYYLYFDGVDDALVVPSMTFTTIELTFSVTIRNTVTPYFINEEGAVGFVRFPSGYMGHEMDFSTGKIYLDGSLQEDMSLFIPNETKVSVRYVHESSVTTIMWFLGSIGLLAFTKGKLWDIKFYNRTTLQAHYNLTTGDSRDRSGNNRHPTVVGAIFVQDETAPPPLNAPSVTIVSQSRQKLSPIPPMDKSTLKFKFDQDVTDWAVMVLGSDYSTGTMAGSGKNVAKDVEIAVDITHQMLYQEGDNRINIYGRNSDGQWTPYD